MTTIKQDKSLIRWANDNSYPTFENLVAVNDRDICIGVGLESPGHYQVRVPVETGELVWNDETREILDDTFFGLGASAFDGGSGEIVVAVNGESGAKGIRLVEEVCERFSRALRYAGVVPRHHCSVCSGENPDDGVNRDGSIVPVHAGCMSDKPGDSVAVTQVFARPNYLLGAVAALFGGLFSTMFTFVIAYKGDTLVDILYILLPVCAMVAYRAAHGRQNAMMYFIVSTASYLAAMTSLFGLLYMSHSMLWGYYPPLDAFLNALMQPAAFQNLQTMILRVLIYTTFGLFLTIYYFYKVKKIRAGLAQDSWLVFNGGLRIPQKLIHPVTVQGPSSPLEESVSDAAPPVSEDTETENGPTDERAAEPSAEQ